MKLNDLRKLRRDVTGRIPWEVLESLELPMPNDVLEQFVFDHGLKHEFQRQYGSMDLHSIDWKKEQQEARNLITATRFSGFERYFTEVTHRTSMIHEKGWEYGVRKTEWIEAWKKEGTWIRPPVFIRKTVPAIEDRLHLVEGHTRTATLCGLVTCGELTRESLHLIWVGEPINSATHFNMSEVIKNNHISFGNWLFDQMETNNQFDELAEKICMKIRSDLSYSELINKIENGRMMPELREDLRGAKGYWKNEIQKWIDECR